MSAQISLNHTGAERDKAQEEAVKLRQQADSNKLVVQKYDTTSKFLHLKAKKDQANIAQLEMALVNPSVPEAQNQAIAFVTQERDANQVKAIEQRKLHEASEAKIASLSQELYSAQIALLQEQYKPPQQVVQYVAASATQQPVTQGTAHVGISL